MLVISLCSRTKTRLCEQGGIFSPSLSLPKTTRLFNSWQRIKALLYVNRLNIWSGWLFLSIDYVLFNLIFHVDRTDAVLILFIYAGSSYGDFSACGVCLCLLLCWCYFSCRPWTLLSDAY
jgi:hypothetical protein